MRRDYFQMETQLSKLTTQQKPQRTEQSGIKSADLAGKSLESFPQNWEKLDEVSSGEDKGNEREAGSKRCNAEPEGSRRGSWVSKPVEWAVWELPEWVWKTAVLVGVSAAVANTWPQHCEERRACFSSEFEGAVHHGSRSVRSWSHGTHSQEAKMDAGAQLTFSFLFSQGFQPREWCYP